MGCDMLMEAVSSLSDITPCHGDTVLNLPFPWRDTRFVDYEVVPKAMLSNFMIILMPPLLLRTRKGLALF